jgi:hypothetical protein
VERGSGGTPLRMSLIFGHKGYETMYKKGKPYNGYCYMHP